MRAINPAQIQVSITGGGYARRYEKAILIAFFRKDKCTNDAIPYIGI